MTGTSTKKMRETLEMILGLIEFSKHNREVVNWDGVAQDIKDLLSKEEVQ